LKQDNVIYVAGGDRLVGAAIVRRLRERGFRHVVGAADEPDLLNQESVDRFFARYRPQYVFHTAGPTGGIGANVALPADLCRDNLAVNLYLVDAAHRYEVERLLYLASSCCYPRQAPQPLRTESLWSGPLEPTNYGYAVAKLAGVALCQSYRQQYGRDFIVGIAANSYGPGDDFDPDRAHVIGALMARMHEAHVHGQPTVTIWGSGAPRREFLYVDDLADACLHVMEQDHQGELINLSGGPSLSIAELAEQVRQVVGYEGRLVFDSSRPDGMPLKALDPTPLLNLGWRPQTNFRTGLHQMYAWYLQTETSRLVHVG
jgi:GDP-L-fucose synthase